MVEMDEVLAFLEAKKRGENPSQSWVQLKNVKLKDGTTIGEYTVDLETPEQERQAINELLQSEPMQQSSSSSNVLLSEVVEKFCANQELIQGNWTKKTAKENRATFALFIRIVGDEVFLSLKHEQLQDFKAKFLKLPANINKLKDYRDKTISEILQMPNVTPMARNTQNKKLNCISSLFKWSVFNDFTDKNYAELLPIGKDKNPQGKVNPFEDEELKALFESQEYQEQKFRQEHYYWVPLIALYTGARLNEVCQLRLKDIKHLKNLKQIEDLYVFDFNDGEEDQSVKNCDSNRITPIHSKLIDLGLIRYVKELKLQNETRLFPEILKGDNNYADNMSKWYSRYLVKKDVKTGRNTVFHSFRHTVINHLKQKLVPEEIVKDIVGHHNGSVTFGVYGNRYNPEVLQPIVEMLQFDIEHTKFHQD